MTGYHRTYLLFNSIIERLVAGAFLLASLPVFIVVPVIIKLQDGGPVFYISRRMGKDKQLFNMYKFRSLAPQTEQNIGGQLLHHSHEAEIPFGRFLRDTRLDEIPQLLNVMLAHMRFWGPRPERPSLYAEHCAHLPGYDRRFAIKPGLLGFSQIFTPHSTPKRIRALIDNRYINKHKNMGCLRAAGVMFFLLLRLARKGLGIVQTRLLLKLRMSRTVERRALERIIQSSHSLEIDGDDNSTDANNLRLININDDCMYLYTRERLPDAPIHLRLKIKKNVWFSHRIKLKTARFIGKIHRHQKIDRNLFNNAYLISYSAYSPFNRYLIDKYLLKKSIL